ncbi:MAG TPA: FtsW/RodA/SpoVE family cell cycle protein, partial [Candidatus Babeliaceae bacterium]|nr:FtsW/RodA/SpoVE family cell cycle protein [Candidatus Babeliaceae bacterium]
MLIDQRLLRHFDWLSLILTVVLSVIGLLCVFSATYRPEVPYSLFFKKQLFGIISGFILYAICCYIDYRNLQQWGYLLFFATIGLLIFAHLKGSIGMGAQRWINLGLFKLQPSELTKLFFPPFFSFYLAHERNPQPTWLSLSCLFSIFSVSILLILKQPDLGTALIILFSALILLWLTGIKHTFFLSFFSLCILCAPISWKFLKPYQKQRIAVFLGQGDSKKERYQLEQSKIAIGSGGLLGKGFLQGTQNTLKFLPESRTDCIFSVLAEEWGLLGC